MLSGVPFEGPVSAARVGLKNDEFVLNPASEKISDANKLDLVIAGTKDAVLMVESEAMQLNEETMLNAIKFASENFSPVIDCINEFIKEIGIKAMDLIPHKHDALLPIVTKFLNKKLTNAYKEANKQQRNAKIESLKIDLKEHLASKEEFEAAAIEAAFKATQSKIVRELALNSKLRIDGRSPFDIRKITVETDILPRTHGSALFTRGETQALVVTTLGSGEDEQMVDDIEGVRKDRFMLHYNFPNYSVNETGRVGAPGRREIGHGKLAFRSISSLIPSKERFPYTIRVVSEITESNGSSSMATVCGTSLSLMAAGVPLQSPVAGIAMGLIKEKDKFVVLSDIMGDEDYLGDMDFKVAGTQDGITALQMDIKIKGITEEIMTAALKQAKDGRLHILNCMSESISKSRESISKNAPQIHSLKIPKEKIGELIGPGGKMIKSIIEQTNVKIDITDDGIVNISSISDENMQAALALINDIIVVAEIGKIYKGKVVKITDFGAFVSIMKNCEGLVHVSEMANHSVKHPRDVVSEGQVLDVKVLDIDKLGRVKLSIKAIKLDDQNSDSQHKNDFSNKSVAKNGNKPKGDHKKNDAKPTENLSSQEPKPENDAKKLVKKKFKHTRPNNESNDKPIKNNREEKKLRFF